MDWLLTLPPELSRRFTKQVVKYEAKKHMPYVTSTERLAKEEGWREGRQEGELVALRDCLVQTLEVRFGVVPQSLKVAGGEVTNPARLRRLHRPDITCRSLAEFRRQVK